jgi:hypothetical protein
MSDKFEYRVVSGDDQNEFSRMINLYLNDGTGWELSGGVSIAVQFTTRIYAQALIRNQRWRDE